MDVSQLPLNALRAFEASARLNSFTRAGLELHISQTAVSHHVKALEEGLGIALFKRMPRGVVLTDEGERLLPVLTDAFRRMSAILTQFQDGSYREVLTIGAVTTFALGCLLPRIKRFEASYPGIELRLKTNNNRADFLGDGLDSFIRFGDGAWHGAAAEKVFTPAFSPVCSPNWASGLTDPAMLLNLPLLRTYRRDEWSVWFRGIGLEAPRPAGFMFDSSHALVEAAALGVGVALVPVGMFASDLECGRIAQPFDHHATLGSYWVTWLNSRRETAAMKVFRQWLVAEMWGQANRAAQGRPFPVEDL